MPTKKTFQNPFIQSASFCWNDMTEDRVNKVAPSVRCDTFTSAERELSESYFIILDWINVN